MDPFAPQALQPRNMNTMPQAPLPMSPMPEQMQAAPIAVPPGVDPARWLQLPPEMQMHYWSMLQGMESAKPGMPLYGPAAPREVPTPSMEPPRKETESFKF